MRPLSIVLPIALPALIAAQAECDQEYECEYRDPSGAFYDLRGLCLRGVPYTYTDAGNNTYYWQICGTSNARCVPQYPVEYERGVAIQFFGDAPPDGTNCTNKAGQIVPCTKDCEVLGIGVPIFTTKDPKNPFQGINVTHYSVASLPTDPFQCPYDPNTGGAKERSIKFVITCNHQENLRPKVTWGGEVAPCEYEIWMDSVYGCGCEPFCYGRNCGDDGCHGYCGPTGMLGECPFGSECNADGVCCIPDCRGRACGSDGCGGSCGDCAPGWNCTKYQQCYNPFIAPTPMPSLLPSATISTTTGSDKFAAFVGGGITTGVVALIVVWVIRMRAGL